MVMKRKKYLKKDKQKLENFQSLGGKECNITTGIYWGDVLGLTSLQIDLSVCKLSQLPESDEGLVSIRTSKNGLKLRYSQLLDIWALFSVLSYQFCVIFLFGTIIYFMLNSCLVNLVLCYFLFCAIFLFCVP